MDLFREKLVAVKLVGKKKKKNVLKKEENFSEKEKKKKKKNRINFHRPNLLDRWEV